ncbi:hypothetical protein ACF3MZ_17530 [Paenibacillaceae bacterium WGS1546]|uniref:hypothetical protein n=1 Tax=Cohnella sp. WGS1546 TaxID=3366810 RepID=UPI00372D7F91
MQRLIESIVKQYVGREGFIPYRQTNDFANEILEMLEETNSEQDPSLALEIALLVLEEGVNAFQYADNSDGDIDMLVEETLEHIWEMSNSLDPQDSLVRERFFERLFSASRSRIVQEYEDSQIALFRICSELADTEKHREKLKSAIENQLAVNANNEALYKILFRLIRDYGSSEEADNFVQEHLSFTFFRELAIKKCMENQDYERAIELSKEGERQDQQLPGLLSKWKAARYEACKKLSLRQEQESLAKELLFGGDYAYYAELESLFEGDKEELYRSILAELKQANHLRARHVYLQLISDKKDFEEMMVYVRTNPIVIEEYAPRLVEHYREEVEQIYSSHIHNIAGAASKRKQYQRVCAMLKRYKAIAGKASQKEIILQLEALYCHRPAFMDELAKLA